MANKETIKKQRKLEQVLRATPRKTHILEKDVNPSRHDVMQTKVSTEDSSNVVFKGQLPKYHKQVLDSHKRLQNGSIVVREYPNRAMN